MKLRHPIKILTKVILLTVFVAGIVGCSNRYQSQNIEIDANTSTDYQELIAVPTHYDQQAELYKLIILAKIAVGQKRHKLALEYYTAALTIKNDISIVKEAIKISELLHDQPSAIKIARLWIKLKPEAIIPWKLITYYSIANHQTEAAQIGIEKLLVIETNRAALTTFFKRIANNRIPVSNHKRNAHQSYLLNLFQSAANTYPDNPVFTFAIASVFQQQKQWSKALKITALMVKRHPDFFLAWKLHGSLLSSSEKKEDAVKWYEKLLGQFPDANSVRHTLGHLQYSLNRFPEARKQFERILSHWPKDSDTKYMIAACYYSENNYPKSRQYFEPLLKILRHRNPVLYYLAEMSRRDSDFDVAISLYQQINSSRYYQAAHILVARLMIQQGRNKQALEYLQTLNPRVEDSDLRYMRALLAADQGNIGLAEDDLRLILVSEPNHADALNALGYTLADANIKLDEARKMIEKAYNIEPLSSAIIDSMGWVLYRLQKLPEALAYLQQAYEMEPSDEIASHLAEILWMLNQKQQARHILSLAIKQSPNSKTIHNMIEKYTLIPLMKTISP